MGFSFRSIFPPGSDSPGQESGAASSQPAAVFIGQSPFQASPGGQPAATPLSPQMNAGPLGQAMPLFKAVAGESFQASPFSAPASAPVTPPLTVGDVLPQMPPEVARMSGLPPEHPVALPAEVLEKALSSGQPAVPLFEIWRVCPALFQAPVSPQDPRLIPLPASKLPRLIATAQAARTQNGSHPGNGAPHPLGETPASAPVLMSQASGGLFGGNGGTALPPKRNGPPPPLADASSPFSVSLPPRQEAGVPPQPGAQAFPVSPFSAVRQDAAEQAPPPAAASPFQAVAQAGSPFQVQAAATNVPSAPAAASVPAAVNGTIFSPAPPAQPESAPVVAPPAASPQSPFTALFGSKAASTGQPAPDAPPALFVPAGAPASPAQPLTPSFSAGPPASSMPPAALTPTPVGGMTGNGGSLRLSLAALLRGYTMAELGFDPMIVPAWIMTSQSAQDVRQWAESASPLVSLGSLVDSVTDVGFRNVLNNARRDFQVQLPKEELQRAFQGDAPPTLPTLSSLKPNAPMVVTPAPAVAHAAFTAFSAPSSQPTREPVPQPPEPVFAPKLQKAAPTQPAVLTSPFAAPAVPSLPPQPEVEKAAFSFTPPAPQENAAFFPAAPAPEITPSFTPAPAAPVPSLAPQFIPAAPPEPPPPPPPPQPQDVRFVQAAEGFGSAELLGAGMAPPPVFPDIPLPAPEAPSPPRAPQRTPEPPPQHQPPQPPAFDPPLATPAPHLLGVRQPGQPALGIQANDSRPDQIVLRALLGTDEELTPQRIVEMTCALPGIAACVCLHGERAISHAGAHKPQAREFQKQATGLSHHLRSLAPLIGIEGAETFTLTSGDRLMTFCFPEKIILAILHDAAPSLGLRDKITLIARELSRMLS